MLAEAAMYPNCAAGANTWSESILTVNTTSHYARTSRTTTIGTVVGIGVLARWGGIILGTVGICVLVPWEGRILGIVGIGVSESRHFSVPDNFHGSRHINLSESHRGCESMLVCGRY